MGAMAEAVVAYAQPLLDHAHGSPDGVNKAILLAQICWNLALMPDQERDEALGEMRPSLNMDDDEFDAFRQSVVAPMIRRHQEMFPALHRFDLKDRWNAGHKSQQGPMTPGRPEAYPGTGRNRPCPCNSGRKYRLCCGR